MADELIDPGVRIYMDTTIHEGRALWYKWIHMIRGHGRIDGLRMTNAVIRGSSEDGCLVHLAMQWEGRDRTTGASMVSAPTLGVRYRLRDGKIAEIWTHKVNYRFIFGDWIRFQIGYRLLLIWAFFYFRRLERRGGDYATDSP
jgi:hypothetical protein